MNGKESKGDSPADTLQLPSVEVLKAVTTHAAQQASARELLLLRIANKGCASAAAAALTRSYINACSIPVGW